MVQKLKEKRKLASKDMLGVIVAIVLGLTVAAAILPQAVIDITNTTKWTGSPAAVTTIVPVIGIVAVVALIMIVLRYVRR